MDDEAKYSILIIDGETSDLDLLNHILKSDYTIHVAKSGYCGLKRAAEDRPDVILLSAELPDMSGFEALYTLKDAEVTRGIPVILVSGPASPEEESKGFLLGAVDHISRPLTHSAVKACVRNNIQFMKHIKVIERVGMVDDLTDIPDPRAFHNQMPRSGPERCTKGYPSAF